MAQRILKALRKKIVEEFMAEHGGVFDPATFVEYIRNFGPEHPAYEWFEWNDDKAADEYRIWQARQFIRDIRVEFSVETMGRNRELRVEFIEGPLAISPVSQRRRGGGYKLLDPGDSQMMEDLCREAAASLAAWLDRYSIVLPRADISRPTIRRYINSLYVAGGDPE